MIRLTTPEQFIVRIVGPDGRTVGVGTLVGPAEVITCAHVVNAALGRDQLSQERPADEITLHFPLIQDTKDGHKARVSKWLPPPSEGASGLDLAGLMLTGTSAPAGAAPARLAASLPATGSRVRVFGYPSVPPRPDGSWVASVVRGRVGTGGDLVQLDSGPDAALRVQPGFSGSPVYDDATGLVIGLIAQAASGQAPDRDSYAIAADRLARAWPDLLATRRPSRGTELTILHLSDTQLGGQHLFGGRGSVTADRAHGALLRGLRDDLAWLATEHGLRPDLMVVTGDLTASGLPDEFEQVTGYLAALAEAAEIPRRHVAIVPGNHDVNRKACEAYFADQESDGRAPIAPYSRKWRQFKAAFDGFYDGARVTFTPDEPWSLFEMPDLSVVVAGLNSTMAESHRPSDHYGYLGDDQLQWFASRLADYRDRGWLRLAAVHHHLSRAAAGDAESLRDAASLDRLLGRPGLVSLLLHGHGTTGRLRPTQLRPAHVVLRQRGDGQPRRRCRTSTSSSRSGRMASPSTPVVMTPSKAAGLATTGCTAADRAWHCHQQHEFARVRGRLVGKASGGTRRIRAPHLQGIPADRLLKGRRVEPRLSTCSNGSPRQPG